MDKQFYILLFIFYSLFHLFFLNKWNRLENGQAEAARHIPGLTDDNSAVFCEKLSGCSTLF